MAKSTLPTKEKLKELYRLKGESALFIYLIRIVLRSLFSIRDVFSENKNDVFNVKNVFAIARVPFVLYFFLLKKYNIDVLDKLVLAVSLVSLRDMYVDFNSEKYMYEPYFDEVKIFYLSAHIALTTMMLASDDEEKVFGDVDWESLGKDDESAAIKDYQFLMSASEELDKNDFLLNVLYGYEVNKRFNNGLKYSNKKTQESWSDFLVNDLICLWNNEISIPHLKNYINDISDIEINDPIALRRIILGETEVEYIHAVRVLLLGSGGSGKSTLADRLQGKPVETNKLMTVGVDYLEHKPLNLKNTFPHLKLDDQELDLFLWDFGGQTIFHGLHSAFLHENCVYVLVVDSRHEQAPDEWLYQIRHLAGSQAKVLLVTNWYEHCETRQNETRLLREFPDLLTPESFFYFSCIDPDSKALQVFVSALVQAALASQKMVAKEMLQIQQALQQRYQDNEFISLDEVLEVIEQVCEVAEIRANMPNKLQQLGFLIRVDSDEQSYCLKPAWAVDHAYELLYSPALREANGILTLQSLQAIPKQKTKRTDINYLVGFMADRTVCKKLEHHNSYFFPDAAPANEPAKVCALVQTKAGLKLRFDLPYLPLGFHARLVNHLFNPNQHVSIQSVSDIWRQGFILRKAESQAVVHYLLRKNSIEVVLSGSLKDFSELLERLYASLSEVLTSRNALREEQIQPFVLWNTQLFSVHSAEDLIHVLGRIKNYDQLFNEVRHMAGTKIEVKVGNNSQVAIDAHQVTQQYQSGNTITSMTADQRQVISNIFDELYKHKDQLDSKAVRVVRSVQNVLEEDAEQPTPETQSKLSTVTEAMSKAVDLTDKSIDVATKVADKWPAITSALAGIGTVFGVS